MNYEEFLDFVKDAVGAILPDAEVTKQHVEKLQGRSYDGISVRPSGSAASATMDLHRPFQAYEKEPRRFAAVMSELLSAIRDAVEKIPQVDAQEFLNYREIKKHLVMQMVPVKGNQELLNKIPHKTTGDIAAVYRVEPALSGAGEASVLLTNELMAQYGVTKEELHRDAVASQLINRPPTLRNLYDVIASMMTKEPDMPESDLWVACVEGNVHGAAAVQCPEFMDKAAEKLGGDFFILPSSIHEVLFVPDNGGFDRRDLENMVQAINETQVEPEDRLSDHVYHYDSREKVFEMAEAFEERMAVKETAAVYGTAREAAADKDTITVLRVEPGEYPRPVRIGTGLHDLQDQVGGFIETSYPFADDACLIMNDIGKIEGLPPNRALRDEDGEVYDIVAGPFLVAGIKGDSFSSLTPDQVKHYSDLFHSPEVFVKMGQSVMVQKVPDRMVDSKKERTAEKKTDNIGKTEKKKSDKQEER